MNKIYIHHEFNGIFTGYSLKKYVQIRSNRFNQYTRLYRQSVTPRSTNFPLWIKVLLNEKPTQKI